MTDSDQLDRLHRLVKLLTNEREQEGHREEISPNHPDSDDQDTPIIYHNVFSDNDDDTPTSLDIHQERDATALALEVSSITSKDDAMTEFLQLVNEKADKLMKSKAEYASLSMWDFAGQYIFYTTHQTFLTHRAIYLLVTDLSQQVTDLVKGDEFYFDTRGVRLCQVQDLAEVWLNSIHSCESSQATNTPVISHDASIVVTPPAASITDTSPHAGTTLTVTATSIAATSTSASTNLSADMRFTPPRASIAAISSSAVNIVTSFATGITATSAPTDTTSTASSAGNKVISSAAGTTMTSHAAGIIVTSSAANITVTSSSAGSMGTYSAGYTALASPGANTPLKAPVHGISSTPPVILVGTHLDKIREDKRQEVSEMYFSQICRFFNDKPFFHNVVRFVPIDNTQVDPLLETLKDLIFQMASKQPYWGEEVPSSWLPMEEALMKLKASGQKVIPRSLIEELNATSSIQIKDAEQLDLFLKMQHEIGTILYFSIDGLKEIILDPQWLIDALKSLITAEMFILVKYPGIRSKWFELKDNGKLTYELIDAVWSKDKNPEFYESKEHLLLVMEQLNVIAKPKIYIEERDELKIKTGNYFLVPCMLRQNTPEEVVCPKLNDQIGSSPVMCYVFVDKVLPSPIFHRILAACVAHWPIATKKKEGMQENLIFCGCCVFQLD